MSDVSNEVLRTQSAACFLDLVEISHPDIATIYIVNNSESITFDGHTWLPYNFSFVFPNEIEGEQTPAKFVCDNVDREISLRLTQASSPATIRSARIMVKSNGSIVNDSGFQTAILREVTWNAFQLSGSIYFDMNMAYYIGIHKYTNNIFPGLFG